MSYVRVVRFTDVDPEASDRRTGWSDIEGRDGPPEGVVATGIQFLHDEDQATMVVLQSLRIRRKTSAKSEEALSGMDPAKRLGPARRSIAARSSGAGELAPSYNRQRRW